MDISPSEPTIHYCQICNNEPRYESIANDYGDDLWACKDCYTRIRDVEWCERCEEDIATITIDHYIKGSESRICEDCHEALMDIGM